MVKNQNYNIFRNLLQQMQSVRTAGLGSNAIILQHIRTPSGVRGMLTTYHRIRNCTVERVEMELLIGGKNGELNGQLNGQLNESQKETMEFIKNHYGLNTTKIAKALNKPFRTIDKHIRVLLKVGLIERRGSKKTGGYYPILTDK